MYRMLLPHHLFPIMIRLKRYVHRQLLGVLGCQLLCLSLFLILVYGSFLLVQATQSANIACTRTKAVIPANTSYSTAAGSSVLQCTISDSSMILAGLHDHVKQIICHDRQWSPPSPSHSFTSSLPLHLYLYLLLPSSPLGLGDSFPFSILRNLTSKHLHKQLFFSTPLKKAR